MRILVMTYFRKSGNQSEDVTNKKCAKIKLTRKGVDKMATQTQAEIHPKYNKNYLILVILVRAIITQCKSYC